jgi:SAM-dependent methyltransferase
MTSSLFNTTCIVDRGEIVKVIDLGMHPFADTFIPKERLEESEPTFPLECGLCLECGLIQLLYITEPNSRYGLYDYSYTSSNSDYAMQHWQEFAGFIARHFPLDQTKILEIGSNDGYLLSQFQEKARKILGIDSSDSIAKVANEAGIPTLNLNFNSENASNVFADHGKFDLIIANNVLNHSNNPLDFLKGVERLLNQGGKFVFEVPYWLSTIETLKFDQIYHEHISYFTIANIQSLVSLTHLKVLDIEKNDYHGGTLRVTLGFQGLDEVSDFSNLINSEIRGKLRDLETYREFMRKIEKSKYDFLFELYGILKDEQDSNIIFVGAAAKANTFINYYRLDSSTIRCVTDRSLNKIGKYTPLSRIPILEDLALKDIANPIVVFTAWNIGTILQEKILSINPETRILKL